MRDSYDFSNGIRNPYIKKLKKQITIRLDFDTVEYFKKLSEETGIKYQQLINLYLSDCAREDLKPNIELKKSLNLYCLRKSPSLTRRNRTMKSMKDCGKGGG